MIEKNTVTVDGQRVRTEFTCGCVSEGTIATVKVYEYHLGALEDVVHEVVCGRHRVD